MTHIECTFTYSQTFTVLTVGIVKNTVVFYNAPFCVFHTKIYCFVKLSFGSCVQLAFFCLRSESSTLG